MSPSKKSDENDAGAQEPVGVEAAPDKEQLPDEKAQLQEQIEETREELGETVQALSQKADVKAQAKVKVEEGKDAVRDQQARAEAKLGEVSEQAKKNPAPFAAGGAAGLFVLILLMRRRRRS